MELIHLGMNDPTSIYGNFTFYLVKYGEPEFDTILKFVGEVPDKHDYLTADGYYEEHSVNEIVFLFEYIYSEDKRKFLRFYYALEKDFTANREKLYTIIGIIIALLRIVVVLPFLILTILRMSLEKKELFMKNYYGF